MTAIVEVCTIDDRIKDGDIRELLAGSTVLLERPCNAFMKDARLKGVIKSMRICEMEPVAATGFVAIDDCNLSIHIYRHQAERTVPEADGEDSAFALTALPAAEFEGIWEGLFYGRSDDGVDPFKGRLMRFVSASTAFADARIDSNLVSFNRYQNMRHM